MNRRLIAAVSVLCVAAPLRLAAQEPLTIGRITQGSIASTDPVNSEHTHYDDWKVSLKARHRYRLTMRSSAFDAFIALGRGAGDSFSMSASDDDGAGGTDASLVYTVPADGDFTVRTRALSSEAMGAYTVAVTDEGEAQPLRAVPIQIGAAVSGVLDSKDAMTDEGKPVDYYRFTARAGRRYVVTLLSQAFDAYLEVGSGANGVFAKQRSDDDGAGGNNARVDWVAREAGEVWILARSFSTDSGRYTLLLEDLGDAPPPAPAIVLTPGRSVEGSLDGSDEQSEQGHYDLYYVDGHEGDIIVIRMDSDAFDPVVAIGQGEGGEWKELDSDDDGGLGTNAHLEYRFPSTGRFLVRAHGIGRENTGAYTIKVE